MKSDDTNTRRLQSALHRGDVAELVKLDPGVALDVVAHRALAEVLARGRMGRAYQGEAVEGQEARLG